MPSEQAIRLYQEIGSLNVEQQLYILNRLLLDSLRAHSVKRNLNINGLRGLGKEIWKGYRCPRIRRSGAQLVGLDEILETHKRWVIDTAPVIYLIEENLTYLHLVDKIFSRLSRAGQNIFAFTSLLTLTEVLTHPLRQSNRELAERYREFLLKSHKFCFVSCR